MAIATNLGYPRLGPARELKWALEQFWAGEIDEEMVQRTARGLRHEQRRMQRDLGIQHIPANDFSFYDEVQDLEAAGIQVIQIDEPALREGLPLRRTDWYSYLNWAIDCFWLATCGVQDGTQIHTHMCYAEFNDIIAAIVALDADVISIETSRSRMELLTAFVNDQYPNDIGPGVYDIHSPRIPSRAEIADLLQRAVAVLKPEQIWVNPDCGLKTRRWEEVMPALRHMVEAAQYMRKQVAASR